MRYGISELETMKRVYPLCIIFGTLMACDSPEVRRGRTHYEKMCRLCHGEDGEGYLSPRANALTNNEFLMSATDEFLRVAITEGRPKTKMSAFGSEFGGPLKNNDISDLIAFLRSYQDNLSEPLKTQWVSSENNPDLTSGKKLYKQECAKCHGELGEGDTALSLNNPTFLITASDAYLRYAIEKGRSDTLMLAYENVFTPQEITNLVAVIRGFSSAFGD